MQIAKPFFDNAEIDALRECLNSGWVTQGPATEKFEQLVATRHQVNYAIATTSCTAALHLAILALGLGPGDEVIVPAFTWVTSAHCAEYVGAKAVFVDVDPATFNLSMVALESALTSRTRAIIAVHLFGLAAPMNEIMQLARERDIAVIEDAACAIGTRYRGQPVGGIGDFGCFSFHPRKVVTTGEGGMVTTNSTDYAQRIRSLRNHGATGLPRATNAAPHGPWTMANFDILGYNLRLSDLQAAVGVAQMAKLERLLAERSAAAHRYSSLLADVSELVVPTVIDTDGHTFQSYVVRLLDGQRDQRNAVMTLLAEHGIQTRPGTHAVPRLGYYREKYALRSQDFPVACDLEDTTITLPIFPGITDNDQSQVAKLIKQGLCKGL